LIESTSLQLAGLISMLSLDGPEKILLAN
jgi:hypothetical protein